MVFFWPQSVETRAALRTAVAALVAILISFFFHLDAPYWSGMTVVVVANLYTGSIIDKAMMRIIGTIAGAFLGFYVAGLVANSFLLYLLSCFLIITIAVYYYTYSIYGYAYLLAALCAFIVISQLALDPQNAFFVAIWRPVEIGIGVVVTALSAYIIFPNHLKDNILVQVDTLFADFSHEFELLFAEIKQGSETFDSVAETNLKIKKEIRKAVELIGALNHEIGVTSERTDELRAILDSFYSLTRQVQYLIITVPKPHEVVAIQTLPLESVCSAIVHDLQALQAAFASNSIVHTEPQTLAALEQLKRHFNQQREHISLNCDFIYSLLHFVTQISQSLLLMHSLLAGTSVHEEPKFKILGKQQRLRADYDLVKQSIKAGLSVMLALVFWLFTSWPGGLTGIISSLMISVRKNLYEMKNISIHRTLGCFLGGGIALCSLLLLEMNLFEFGFILFCCVWAFTYFMFKVPKYSYIGLQANIALLITVAQEGGPPTLLDAPLQRLGGIMIGIVASFIVANVLWRSDVWTILNRYLNKLYLYMTFNLNQVLLVTEGEKSLHDLANLFWISRGLIESLSEDTLSEKNQAKLAKIRNRFEELVILQATISHIVLTIDREKAVATAKKLGLDLAFYSKNLVLLYERHDALGREELAKHLNELLLNIEKKQEHFTENDDDMRMMLAYINALIQLAVRKF